ncbi:hypothetical protein F5Y03DRAFT_367124 [Xylaria venustula]|nr:hypothetical protein F5Y03DRAFT_367124 [Xylaria venustula]
MAGSQPSAPVIDDPFVTEVMDPSNSIKQNAYSFSSAIQEFKIKFPTEPEGRLQKGSSIRSKTNWGEVLEVLEEAATAYTMKAGFKGAVKRAKGFIEDRVNTLDRGLHVVPDISYVKPILGTLTFILEAFKQTSKVRKEVTDGVEKLGKNFDLIETCIEMYSSKPKVANAATDLHVTILKAIEEVIGYYTKHMVTKGLKAVWDGEKYEESLLSCLEDINRVGKELMGEADIAHKQVTNKIAEDVQSGFKEIENLVERAERGLREGLNSMFKDHITAMEVRHEKEKQLLQREIEKRDAERTRFEQLYYRAITPEPPPTFNCITKQAELVEFLDMEGIETADIEYITQQRELIISRGQDRTEQVMKSEQLREWLVQASSRELLIHGNCEPLPISPISFFCARMIQNLRGIERFKSVSFFCGCHPYHEYGGARTLIMSLLAQLLLQQPFDLSFIDPEVAYRMGAGESQAFCYFFGRLVEQVNRDETVFCVIDGINFYECDGEESLQEMADVLRFLLDLTSRRDAVYKILITSPSTTQDVRQAIKDEDYLALPEQASNTLGFSNERFERQWEEGLRLAQR